MMGKLNTDYWGGRGGHLGLDLVGIALGQLLLTGSGDQDVAVSLQDVSFIWRGVGEAHDGPVGLATTQTPRFKTALCTD